MPGSDGNSRSGSRNSALSAERLRRRAFLSNLAGGIGAAALMSCAPAANALNAAGGSQIATGQDPDEASSTPGVSIQDLGAVGDGITDDSASFTASNSQASGIHVPAGNYLIASDITLSGCYVMDPAARFVIASGVRMTFSRATLVAPEAQVFSGSGTVKGTLTNTSMPVAWFGAFPSFLATGDMAPAIQKAIEFAEQGGPREILFHHGEYVCASGLVVSVGGVSLRGVGITPTTGNATILNFSSSPHSTAGLTASSGSAQIYGLTIDSIGFFRPGNPAPKGSGGAGVRLAAISNVSMRNCSVHSFDIGLVGDSTSLAGTAVLHSTFSELEFIECTGSALMASCFIDCDFRACYFGVSSGADRLVRIDSGANGTATNALHFHNCLFVGPTTPALIGELVRVTAGFWITFEACVFEQASQYGIVLFYGINQDISLINILVRDGWFNNAGICVYNAGARTNLQITGGRMESPASAPAAISWDTTDATLSSQHVAIENVSVKFANGSGVGILLAKLRGGRIQGCTITGHSAAANRPTVHLESTCDLTRLIANHSVSGHGTAHGMSLLGENTFELGNSKSST